jgi:hypothetical protein
MACQVREKTGNCGHHQCEFSQETSHGYECVDILYWNKIPFCEIGKNCHQKCKFSWIKGSNSEVEIAMKEWCKNEEFIANDARMDM